MLDVEGVLTPEIWVAVADEFNISRLRRTTQDEPDYAALMAGRIAALAEHNIGLADIQRVIAKLTPIDGASQFLDELRRTTQVILLSDTFEQFIGPLMAQLGHPTILCHSLDIEADRIVGFTPRLTSQKKRAVEVFQAMGYHVVAAGDSFNDLEMIDAADVGMLFRAPVGICAERPDLECYDSYANFQEALKAALRGLGDSSSRCV